MQIWNSLEQNDSKHLKGKYHPVKKICNKYYSKRFNILNMEKGLSDNKDIPNNPVFQIDRGHE